MKYKIFISGVQKELKSERRRIKEFIEGHSLLKDYFIPPRKKTKRFLHTSKVMMTQEEKLKQKNLY